MSMIKTRAFTWAPIRKLVVGAATYAVVFGARKYLHLDLGPDTVAEGVNGALGFAAAYAVKDARVKAVRHEIESQPLAGEVELLVLDAIEKHLPKTPH